MGPIPYCPYPVTGTGSLPDLTFLPSLKRRRLSSLARMVVSCAWPLAEGQAPMPMVFASRHGETSRSFKLLHDLADGEPLSPTAFGLSVHNAILGLWSILRKETEEGVALSGDSDMLEHALQEARLLLAAGAPRVLVVAAEERPQCLSSLDHRCAVLVRDGIPPLPRRNGKSACKPGLLVSWPVTSRLASSSQSAAPSSSKRPRGNTGPTRRWTWTRSPSS